MINHLYWDSNPELDIFFSYDVVNCLNCDLNGDPLLSMPYFFKTLNALQHELDMMGFPNRYLTIIYT